MGEAEESKRRASARGGLRLALIPLALIAVLTTVALVRWSSDYISRRAAQQDFDRFTEALETYDPPVRFCAWNEIGPTDVRLGDAMNLSASDIESLSGMSFFPTAMYQEGRGGALLINPPSQTVYGDSGDDGSVKVLEGDDPWCVDAEGKVITVGQIGASFTIPMAGYTTHGTRVAMHVTLSNFKIKVSRGASLVSSADAAATGTGFTLGEDGTISGLKSGSLVNTAPNAAGEVQRHTLAEGQYITALGNFCFLDCMSQYPHAFARPFLLNQCYRVEGASGAEAWKVWDCATGIGAEGQLTEDAGRADARLYNANTSANPARAGVEKSQLGSKDAVDYKDVVSLSFDVDVNLTTQQEDGSSGFLDAGVLVGAMGIDEPDRSEGSSGSYDGPFTESVTWRYGLTDEPIIMRDRTWGSYRGVTEPGSVAFSVTSRLEGLTRFVSLKGLYESDGKAFVATHLAGDRASVVSREDESFGTYWEQERAAGHVTIAKTAGFGFTWTGSGAQTMVLTRGMAGKRLEVESVGDYADKVTVTDLELAQNEGVYAGTLRATVTGVLEDGELSTGPMRYFVPWKSSKTLKATAEEGYHISGVYITPMETAQDEEAQDEEEEEEDLGLGLVDVESMQPGDVRFLKGLDLTYVMMTEGGEVLICPGRFGGSDPVTGEAIVGFMDDTVVRVEARPD